MEDIKNRVLAETVLLTPAPKKIYGAHNIKRYLQTQKREHQLSNSIADKPHKNTREIERHLRQQTRKEL